MKVHLTFLLILQQTKISLLFTFSSFFTYLIICDYFRFNESNYIASLLRLVAIFSFFLSASSFLFLSLKSWVSGDEKEKLRKVNYEYEGILLFCPVYFYFGECGSI